MNCCCTGALASCCPLGVIPNCFCTGIPPNLTMTSADENCNFKMFQSCSISYGPHPGFEALSFGKNYYLSDEGFPDPVANGAVFYYALLCQFNQFSLTRAYLTSPYGSPFRDGILYTWLVGGYGNVCGNGPTSWVINPDFSDWASCIVPWLNTNHPRTDGGDWGLLNSPPINPTTGCTSTTACTYISQAGSFGSGSGCGTAPAVSVPVFGPSTGFLLSNGTAFPGSDPTCSVTISG